MTRQPPVSAPHDIETFSEKAWQSWVVDIAQRFGWYVVHVRNALANPVGLPDLICLRGGEVELAELKSMRGKVSAKQQRLHDELWAVYGVHVHVWYPSDWRDVAFVFSNGAAVADGEGLVWTIAG